MLVEFVGQTVSDSGNISANPSRLINCYRERVLGRGKTDHVLQSVLGQEFVQAFSDMPTRAMGSGNGKNWLVGDGKLFELADAGTLVERAAVADDPETTIGGNYSDVTIVSGGNYYVWNGTAIFQPAGGAFTSYGSHCYVGGYTVLTERAGKKFQWSKLGDAGTLNALHFSSADKVDDNLVRAVEVGGNLLLMCETSTEIWQVTGRANAEAFGFVTSSRTGLKGFDLVAQGGDILFWVGHDNNVYMGVGAGAVDVSTPGLNSALEAGSATHCFYYEDRGHQFCVVRFSDRPAWVFDVKMREWHERAEGETSGPWRVTHSVLGDKWIVGSDAGETLILSRTNKDRNAPLARTAISSPLYLGDRKFRVNKLELNVKVGENHLDNPIEFGLDAGGDLILDTGNGFGLLLEADNVGARPGSVQMQESRDGGRTWGPVHERSLGLLGDYMQRVIWRARGQAQQYAVKIVLSDPADFQVNTKAVLEVV